MPAADLFRGFHQLNQRFTALVDQTCLRVDFQDLSIEEFNTICARMDPKQVESLTLTNEDHTHSSGQMSLFFNSYHLNQFSSLKCLRILQPDNTMQLERILQQLNNVLLENLHVSIKENDSLEPGHLRLLLRSTRSLSLHSFYSMGLIVLPLPAVNHLHRLSCRSITMKALISVLRCSPQLRHLRVKLDEPFEFYFDEDDSSNDSDDGSPHASNRKTLQLLDLRSLSIEFDSVSLQSVETQLLSSMPNLYSLSVFGVSTESVDLFARQWERAILTHIPRLKTFRFYVTGSAADAPLTIEEFLQPFRDPFWQVRQWYVGLDIVNDTIDHVFTLPCPATYESPLRMIANLPRALTTLPASCTYISPSFSCSQAI